MGLLVRFRFSLARFEFAKRRLARSARVWSLWSVMLPNPLAEHRKTIHECMNTQVGEKSSN